MVFLKLLRETAIFLSGSLAKSSNELGIGFILVTVVSDIREVVYELLSTIVISPHVPRKIRKLKLPVKYRWKQTILVIDSKP